MNIKKLLLYIIPSDSTILKIYRSIKRKKKVTFHHNNSFDVMNEKQNVFIEKCYKFNVRTNANFKSYNKRAVFMQCGSGLSDVSLIDELFSSRKFDLILNCYDSKFNNINNCDINISYDQQSATKYLGYYMLAQRSKKYWIDMIMFIL